MSGNSETITVQGHRHSHSTQQYIRACSLVVGNAGGQALDLSTLRIQFTVSHASVQTPKTLVARISNVSRTTAATVQKEFTRVILSAGYEGSLGKLFDGQIRQTKFGRESPTDTYLDIIAADGDQAYSQGFINQVLAPGYTAADVHREVVSAASGLGLTAGTPPPAYQAGIRPKVMFGPIRDHCRVLAASTGTSVSITDNELNFALLDAAKNPSRQAVTLSPTTGLIGIPKQTLDGVEATCLLNPRIKFNSYVTIDSNTDATIGPSTISQASVDTASAATQGGNLNTDQSGNFAGDNYRLSVAGISPSGTYQVVFAEHVGDTRGDPWYTTIHGFAADANAKMTDGNMTQVP